MSTLQPNSPTPSQSNNSQADSDEESIATLKPNIPTTASKEDTKTKATKAPKTPTTLDIQMEEDSEDSTASFFEMEEDGETDQIKNEKRLQYMLNNPHALRSYFQEWMDSHTTEAERQEDHSATMENLFTLLKAHVTIHKQPLHTFLDTKKNHSFLQIAQEAEETITKWKAQEEEYNQTQQVIVNQELLENETEFNKFLQSLIEGIAYLQGKTIPTHLIPVLKADLQVLYVNHCLVLMQHYNSFLEVYKDKSIEEITIQAGKTRNTLKEAGIYDPTADQDAGAT